MDHPIFSFLFYTKCVIVKLSDKESACQWRRWGFNPWVRKIPWRRKWQPSPVFLPGKSHGQRSLAGYNPWCCKESDWVHIHTHTHRDKHTNVDYGKFKLIYSLVALVQNVYGKCYLKQWNQNFLCFTLTALKKRIS